MSTEDQEFSILPKRNIVQVIAQFRAWGVSFLPVPPSYYTQLQSRQTLPLSAAELRKFPTADIG